jgi:hypothetical protein
MFLVCCGAIVHPPRARTLKPEIKAGKQTQQTENIADMFKSTYQYWQKHILKRARAHIQKAKAHFRNRAGSNRRVH